MELHYKCKVWMKIILDTDMPEQEVIEKLEAGETPLSFFEDVKYNHQSEVILESEELLTVQQNGGSATISLMKEDGDFIWTNSQKEDNT